MGIGRAAQHSRIALPSTLDRGEPSPDGRRSPVLVVRGCWRGLSHLDPSPKRLVHSLGLIHSRAARRRRARRFWRSPQLRSAHANRTARRATAKAARCRPGYRLARRICTLRPGATRSNGRRSRPRRATRRSELAAAALASRHFRGQGWADRIRADPGRAGAVALAVIAALAVLVTVFTLIRDRTEPVMSAKLPPVEPVSPTNPRSSASPGSPDRSGLPVVVSVVGLVHTP